MTRRSGFTLVEVLIVMLILCLLALQMLPSFHSFVVRTRRSEGQAALLQLMQQQERYYTQHNRYIAFSSASDGEDEKLFQWWSGSKAPSSSYEIEGKACEGETIEQCVQLVASPGTDKVDPRFRDEECQQLKLSSTGVRLATGPGERCWP